MEAREPQARRRWMCRDPGLSDGPLTATDVIQALLDRKMSPDSELCEEGSSEWRPVRDIDQFRIATRAVRGGPVRKPAPASAPKAAPQRDSSLDDEEDIKTRVATFEETENDEEDVKTQYYGADGPAPSFQAEAAQPAAAPAPAAGRPAAPPPAAGRPAAPAPAAGRPAAPPPAAGIPAAPPPAAGRPAAPPPAAQAQPVAAAPGPGPDRPRTKNFPKTMMGLAPVVPQAAPPPPREAPGAPPAPAPAPMPLAAPAPPERKPSAPFAAAAAPAPREPVQQDNDLEEDACTQYYQPGGSGPSRLPSFQELAAAEQAAQQKAAPEVIAPPAGPARAVQPGSSPQLSAGLANPKSIAFAKTMTAADAAAAMEQMQRPGAPGIAPVGHTPPPAHGRGPASMPSHGHTPAPGYGHAPPPAHAHTPPPGYGQGPAPMPMPGHTPPPGYAHTPAPMPAAAAQAGVAPQTAALMQQVYGQDAPIPQAPPRRGEPQTRLTNRNALPQFGPGEPPPGLPWFKLALMAVIGAVAGLILALVIAVLFKLARGG